MKPMHEDEARLARELEPRSAAVWAVFLVAIAALGVLMFAPTPPWPMADGPAGRPALADSAERGVARQCSSARGAAPARGLLTGKSSPPCPVFGVDSVC